MRPAGLTGSVAGGVRSRARSAGRGVLSLTGAVVASTATLVGALLAIRVVLFKRCYGFRNLAVVTEVLPKSDLVTVDNHLVKWLM